MVYIITISKFPSHIAAAVGKRYLESLQKYPPDPSLGETIVPSAIERTEDGIQAIGITEVKKGKLEEALERSQNVASMFNDLEGFEGSIKVHMTASEALTTIGMKIPE